MERLRVDTAQAVRFLNLLGYSGEDLVSLRKFGMKGDGGLPKEVVARLKRKLGEGLTSKPIVPLNKLPNLQDPEMGYYFVVNAGGQEDIDITEPKAIFFESDKLSIEEQKETWRRYGLPEPTAQVQTRKSVHTHFAIAKSEDGITCTREQWLELQWDLLNHVKNDDMTIRNLAQLMRMPGSWHVKYQEPPVRCELIHEKVTHYTYEYLRSVIPHFPAHHTEARDYLKYRNITVDPSYSGYLAWKARQTMEDTLKAFERFERDLRQGSANTSDDWRKVIQAINLRLDMEQIYDHPDHKFQKRNDRQYDGGCCNHKSSSGTSFQTTNDDGTWVWYCKGCGVGGGPIEYRSWRDGGTLKPRGKDFINIIRPLAEQAGIELPERKVEKQIQKPEQEKAIAQPEEKPKVKLLSEILKELDESIDRSLPQEEVRHLVAQYGESNRLPFDTRKTLYQQFRDYRQSDELLPVQDVHEVMAEPVRHDMIISGVLPSSAIVLLVASGGTGKTTFCYSMAKAIASKDGEWSGYPTIHGRVLVIQADESKTDMRRKMAIQKVADEVGRERFHVNFNWDWDFSMWEATRNRILKEKYSLVIIDSLTATQPGLNPNLPEFAANLYKLRSLIEELEQQKHTISFICVHHMNAIGGIRGTTALRDNASEVWEMSQGKKEDGYNDDDVLMKVPKSRSGLAGQYLLRRSRLNYGWTFLGSIDNPDELNENESTEEFTPPYMMIYQFLSMIPNQRMSARDIFADMGSGSGLTNVEHTTAVLRQMVASGCLKCEWVPVEMQGVKKTGYMEYWIEPEDVYENFAA